MARGGSAMSRWLRRAAWAALVLAACLGVVSCRTAPSRNESAGPTDAVVPTVIQYVDSDGFDNVLESALVNQDAAVIVRTTHDKPDWGPRLNAWIAAWNRGGRARSRTARGQAPGARGGIDGARLRQVPPVGDGVRGPVE